MRWALRILWKTLIVAGLALAVILALFVFWVPGLVEDELKAALDGLGLPGTTVRVVAITPDGARLADLDLGGEGRATAGTVDVEYEIGKLLDGWIDRIVVTGARFEARLTEEGLDLGPIDRMEKGGESDGPPELPFGSVSIRQSTLVVVTGEERIRLPVDGRIENTGDGRLGVELETEVAGEAILISAVYRLDDGSATATLRSGESDAEVAYAPAEDRIAARIRATRDRIEVRLPTGRVEAEGITIAADLVIRGMEVVEAAEVRLNAALVRHADQTAEEIVLKVEGREGTLDILAFAKYRGLDVELEGVTPADLPTLTGPAMELPVTFRVEGEISGFVAPSIASGYAELSGGATVTRKDGRVGAILRSFTAGADLDLPGPMPMRAQFEMKGSGRADESRVSLSIDKLTAAAGFPGTEAPAVRLELKQAATVAAELTDPPGWSASAPAIRVEIPAGTNLDLPSGLELTGVSGELGLAVDGDPTGIRLEIFDGEVRGQRIRDGELSTRNIAFLPRFGATLGLGDEAALEVDFSAGSEVRAEVIYAGGSEELRGVEGRLHGRFERADGRFQLSLEKGSELRAASYFGPAAISAEGLTLRSDFVWDGNADSGKGQVELQAKQLTSADAGVVEGVVGSATVEVKGPLDSLSAEVAAGSTLVMESFTGTDGATAGKMQFAIRGGWQGGVSEFGLGLESAGPIEVKRGDLEASISELAFSSYGSLEVLIRPEIWAEVTLGVSRIRTGTGKPTVSDLHLVVPFALGEQSRNLPGEGHLRVGSVRIEGKSFRGPAIRLGYQGGHYELDGLWSPLPGAAITLKGGFDPDLRGGRGEILIGGPAFPISPEGPLGGLVKKLSGTSLTGNLSISGRVGIAGGRVRPEVRLQLADAVVTSAEDTQRFEGVKADITIVDIDPPRTAGGQRVSWRGGKLGDFDVGNGGLRFTVETPKSILVERAAFSLGDAGQAFAHSFRINPDAPEITADIFVENLSLKRWLNLVASGDARGEGRLHGRLPIRIGLKPRLRLALGEGFLYSDGGGVIEVPDTKMVEGILKENMPSLAGETDYGELAQQRMVQALRDFEFEKLSFEMIGSKRNQTLRVVVVGKGRQEPHQEMNLTVNFKGIDEVIGQLMLWKFGFEKKTGRFR